MKLNVFGRKVEVVKSKENWKVFILEGEGKKRIADNIFIPSSVNESEIVNYLSDMYHEWATPSNNQITTSQ